MLLLGGPNTYLPFLQECWRQRIPETWDERGYDYPKDVPIEELIFVPENAQYYAAFGAVRLRPARAGRRRRSTRASTALDEFITNGRKARLGETAGPPLVEARATSSTTSASSTRSRKFDAGDARAGPGRARRHRPRRRLDLVEGRAHRRGRASILTQGVPALEGQPDPGHQGAPRAAPATTSTDQGATLEVHGLRRHRLRGRRARGVRASRREHRRDRRPHDARGALLRRRRRRSATSAGRTSRSCS